MTLVRKQSLLLAALAISIFGSLTFTGLHAQEPGTGQTQNQAQEQDQGLEFNNSPVAAILDQYELLTNKHLIRDIGLNNAPPMSLKASNLNRADAVKLMEATLQLNGITIVPVDATTAKVVFIAGAAKNPRSEGIKLYANAEDLPHDDAIVSYYMPFSYISAQEAQTIFQAQAPPHLYGSYVPAPSAQALIITENANTIWGLIAIKELIDVPPAHVSSEFIQLVRADAEKVADIMSKLLDPKNAAAVPGAQPSIVPANVGLTGPLSNERNLLSGMAQIVPDVRSNRLLVITRPANMPFLRQLISQLDQPDQTMQPQRRVLQYVQAQDILPALEASLAMGKEEQSQAKQDGSTAGNRQNVSSPPSNTSTPTALNNGSNASGGAGGGGISGLGVQSPTQSDVPTFVTVGKTRILADNRSNCIIIFGPPDATARVFQIIDQLDHKPLQVYLATVIGQLTVSEGQEFGIDILQKFQHVGQGGIASSQRTTGLAVPDPRSLLTPAAFPLPTGLTLYGAIGSTIDAYVKALETTNHFKIISRPSIYTANNKHAMIASGSLIPVPSSTTSGFTGGSSDLVSTSSITYEQVLLQLDVVPLINAAHQVTLQIQQTNNTQGDSQVISGNSVPTILTQVLNTSITVPDKSTIVIGGLISDNTKRGATGVPFLMDIPILGYLFQDVNKSKNRNELIIMIQPTVIETEADEIAANEVEKGRTILGREAVEASQRKAVPEYTGLFHSDSSVSSPAVAPASMGPVAVPPATAHGTVVPARGIAPPPDVSNGQLPPDAPNAKKTPTEPHP